MKSMPRLYDISTDTLREATQADVDRLQDVGQAFGQLVAFLRAGLPAVAIAIGVDIAVKRAQGSVDATASAAAFTKLLERAR